MGVEHLKLSGITVSWTSKRPALKRLYPRRTPTARPVPGIATSDQLTGVSLIQEMKYKKIQNKFQREHHMDPKLEDALSSEMYLAIAGACLPIASLSS